MKFLKYAAIALAAVFMNSCDSDSGNGGAASPVYVDIVTVAQMTDNNTVFTFQKDNDSPVITLTADGALDKQVVKVGDRVLLSYQTEGQPQYTNGEIHIVAAALTYGRGGDFDVATAAATDNFRSNSVPQVSAWQTGSYLNLAYMYSTDTAPKECRIVVDEATLTDEYPQLYFIFVPQVGMGNDRTLVYYMSYTLEGLFSMPTCKGVTLNYTENSKPVKVDFEKVDSALRPNV